MSKSLFNEFEPVSIKAWKQKIQLDLKGADYNNTLIWNSIEGVDVKPFYHLEDFKLSQGIKTEASKWDVCQSIFVADVVKSNIKAIDILNRGAESIKFIIPSEDISIDELIKNIDLTSISLHFELQFLSESFVKQLNTIAAKAKISIHTDIIGNLAKSGNWYSNLKEDHSKFETIVKQTLSFGVDMSLYQNAGANIIQQLTYGLAHTNEYLNHLDNIIANDDKQSLKVIFNTSIGTNYFFEIAKLRALRLLWNTLASEYNINTDCHIIAAPTKRNKTLYDYNTNMLRTTTECMSAILGGANTVCNLSYDAIYHKDNEFGERISRNQLLVLKHESYFDKIDNPADGAYYIEELTHQFAEKALELFKDIETNGGFLQQLKEGTIQRKIKESAIKEQTLFNDGEEVLLGTNKHPNPNDKMKHDLELYPFIKINTRKTLIEPIIEKRLAETVEQKRLDNE
ncbi:methylmalonyl-CoA mutase [Flavobacteriaceae bacterium AU392]|nr:methylmalonyl-CoA mutase [Flavobacteriaceae bacterium]RKM83655.1 methylmalonyl-CoA mutase [Flavobacteriaceae bacterium AU392]